MRDRFFDLPPELRGGKDLSETPEIPDLGFLIFNHFDYRIGIQERVSQDGEKPVGLVLQIWWPTMPWFKITLPFHGLEACRRFIDGFNSQMEKLEK